MPPPDLTIPPHTHTTMYTYRADLVDDEHERKPRGQRGADRRVVMVTVVAVVVFGVIFVLVIGVLALVRVRVLLFLVRGRGLSPHVDALRV